MRFAQCVPILVLLLNFSSAGQLTRGKVIPFFDASFSDFFQYGCHILFTLLGLEPEAYFNTAQMIEYYDYPVEVHQVTTGDDYVLEIYRIAGKNRYDTSEPSGLPRSPVVLFTEVAFPSTAYLLNTRNHSLGFILADAGFDVWLASWRGTEFSRKHVTLDPDSTEYWKFGLDEMGKYDVADTVKYVHKLTGQKVVTMAEGYGGLTVMLGLISVPEINNMINLNVGLSTTATMNSSFSNNVKLVYNMDVQYALKLADATGVMRGGFKDPAFAKFFLGLGASIVPPEPVIRIAVMGMGISGTGSFNMSRVPIYATHIPTEGSYPSARQILHGLMTNEVRQYDWGKEENLRRHGTAEPQLYDFKKISSNYLVLRTFNDQVKDRVDTDDLRRRLPDHHDFYMVPDKNWHHMSYIYSIGGKAAVYDYLIDYIRKLESGEPYRNIEL